MHVLRFFVNKQCQTDTATDLWNFLYNATEYVCKTSPWRVPNGYFEQIVPLGLATLAICINQILLSLSNLRWLLQLSDFQGCFGDSRLTNLNQNWHTRDFWGPGRFATGFVPIRADQYGRL